MNQEPLTVAEACAAILREVAPLDTISLPIAQALECVIAEDVRSPLALPPWDNSSMDGYAVRADDIRGASRERPKTLTVVGTVAAGGQRGLEVARGQAVRIMTGGAIPKDADTVVRIEDTDGDDRRVSVFADRDALRNIRPRGEDMAANDVAVAAGSELHPGHIGLLASVGRSEVRVHRRPLVAILASGDELADVGDFDQVLAGKRIVSSNTYSLEAAVRQSGGVPLNLGFVGDDPAALRRELASVQCDLLLTTGGVSVGAFDYTRSVMTNLGVQQRFWRVRIRPGAPLGFGLLGATPWLGLPGNPVSTLVTFELFARPAIRKLMGHELVFRRPTSVRLAEAVTINAPLTHFLRATVGAGPQGLEARLTGPQGSGLLSSMARANALLVIPPEQQRLEAGQVVAALVLRPDAWHAAELTLGVTGSTA